MTKKRIKTFTFLKYSFLWKRAVTANLEKFSLNTIFRWYTFGNFTLSNSAILVEDLIEWKIRFEIFLIDYSVADIGKKGRYQAGQFTQGGTSIMPWFIWYTFYLSACNRVCLEDLIAIFYLCHSKNSSNIMKNIFNSISIYSWKKIPH